MPYIPAEIYYSRTERAPISAPLHEQLPAQQRDKLSSITSAERVKIPRDLLGKYSLKRAPMSMASVAKEMLPDGWSRKAGKP